nr:MAG: RNA-dependent RNA polymerase [Xiaogan peribunya-like virus 1]
MEIVKRVSQKIALSLSHKFNLSVDRDNKTLSEDEIILSEAILADTSFTSLKELAISPDCQDTVESGVSAMLIGILDYCREVETIAESMIFQTRSAVKTMTISMGLNSNQLVLIFPTDSVLSTGVQVPYVTLTKIKNEEGSLDIKKGSYVQDGKHQMFIPGEEETLVISKGKRIDMVRLNKLASMKEHFLSAFLSLQMIRERDGSANKVSLSSILKTFLMTYNVSISTSSLLDNIHWLVDAAMADYSFCDEYIEDKLMVACRNDFQMWLYGRTKTLLRNLNVRAAKMGFRGMTVDQDGYVDVSMAEQISSMFPSILDESHDFNQLFSLISECQVAYFSCPKALHEKAHNLISIHRTPVNIQREIEEFLDKAPTAEGHFRLTNKPGGRYQFSPNYIIRISQNVNNNLQKTISSLRDSIKRREQVDTNPLHIKTMTSTRSVLINEKSIKRKYKSNSKKNKETGATSPDELKPKFDSHENLLIRENVRIEKRKIINIIQESARLSKPGSAGDSERINLKKMRKIIRHKLSDEIISECEKGGLEHSESVHLARMHCGSLDSAKVNLKTGKVRTFKSEGDEANEKIPLRLDTNCSANYVSSVVLTETLNDALFGEEEDYEEMTIGKKAKNSILDDEVEFVFANRPKGQRTQADREIYILTKDFKDCMYIPEHVYKAVSSCIAAECISTPGDFKTLEIQRQAREMLTAQMKLSDSKKESVLLHFNIDMTKWAPKDVLLKYSYLYANANFLTKGEKRYLITLIIKAMEKKMHVSDLVLRTMEKSRVSGKKFDDDKTLYHFCNLDEENGIWRNLVPIQDTWLMGQWNYPSSIMHAGAMIEVKNSLEKLYGRDKVFSQLNVHSDDNQCSFLIQTKDSEERVMMSIWERMEYYTRLGCMEISRKKTNISKVIKQLVSQYNIGGVQKSLDVKQLMSSVSGLPWTSPNDDYSSVVSKLCSALCQGSLPEYVRPLMVSQFRHVGRVYGSVRKGLNMISEKIGIPEHMLPMCLGGGCNTRMDLLALGGSKMIDKYSIYKLLKDHCGSNSERPPYKLPEDEIGTKAIRLFLICDTLSQETIIDVEDQMTHGINIFKPIRFQARKNTWKDPFDNCQDEDLNLPQLNKEFMESRPSMYITKPKDILDCIQFYSVLYTNSSFRAALTSQNPNTLKLSKICNRAKGNFRFVSEASFQLYKLEHLFDTGEKVTLNGVDLADIFDSAMSRMSPLDIASLEYLWRKYVYSDPELISYLKVDESSIPVGTGLRPNPVAIRKPTFQNFFTIINPVSDILMYIFDEANFSRDKRKIRYTYSLLQDFENLATAFPAILPVLEKLSNERPENYQNYLTLKKDLRNVLVSELSRKNVDLQKSMFQNRQLMLKVLSDCGVTLVESDSPEARERKLIDLKIQLEMLNDDDEVCRKQILNGQRMKGNWLENRAREQLKRNERQRSTIRFNIEQLSLSQAIQEEKERQLKRNLERLDLDPNMQYSQIVANLRNIDWIDNYIAYLPQRLADMVRQLSPGQKRVIFSSRENERDASDVLLSLKTLFSCRNGICTKFIRSAATYSSEIKNKILGTDKKSVENMRAACAGFYNLVIICLRLGLQMSKIREVVLSAEYDNIDLNKVIMNYSSLEHWRRKKLIYICSLLFDFKEYKDVFESTRDSKEHWIVKQTTPKERETGKFEVVTFYPGAYFRVKGTGGLIEKCHIIMTKSVTAAMLGRYLSEFCRCLHPNRGTEMNVKLSEHMKTTKNFKEGKNLYLNPMTGMVSMGRAEGCLRILGFSIELVPIIEIPPISNVVISRGFTKVDFYRGENLEWELTITEGVMEVNMDKLKVNEVIFPNSGLSLQRIIRTGLWQTLISSNTSRHTISDLSKCVVQRGRLLNAFGDLNAYIASIMIHGDEDRLLFRAFEDSEEKMGEVARLLDKGGKEDFLNSGGFLYELWKQSRQEKLKSIQEGQIEVIEDKGERVAIVGEAKTLIKTKAMRAKISNPIVRNFLGNTEDVYSVISFSDSKTNFRNSISLDSMEVSLEDLVKESKLGLFSPEEMSLLSSVIKHSMYTCELVYENLYQRIKVPTDKKVSKGERDQLMPFRTKEGDPIPHGVFERIYSMVHPLIIYQWKQEKLENLKRNFENFKTVRESLKRNLRSISDPEVALALSYLVHFAWRNYNKLMDDFIEQEESIEDMIEKEIRGEESEEDLERSREEEEKNAEEKQVWKDREKGYTMLCAKMMSKRLGVDFSKKGNKLSLTDIQSLLSKKLLSEGEMGVYTSESETESKPTFSYRDAAASSKVRRDIRDLKEFPEFMANEREEEKKITQVAVLKVTKSRRQNRGSTEVATRMEDEQVALRVQNELARIEIENQDASNSVLSRMRRAASTAVNYLLSDPGDP